MSDVEDQVAINATPSPVSEITASNPEPAVIGPAVNSGTDTSMGAQLAPQTRGIRVVVDDIEKWSRDLLNVIEQSKAVQTIARDAHAMITSLEAEYEAAKVEFESLLASAKAKIEKVL